jgi:hypothetical protein
MKACMPLGFERPRPKGVRKRAIAAENLERAADSEWEKGHYWKLYCNGIG